MGPSEEKLIPLPLYEDMLDESMSSDAEGALFLAYPLQVLLDADRKKSLIQMIHAGSLSTN